MLKNLLMITLFLSLPAWATGQTSGAGRSNEIEQYRIAYLTEKLDLSPAEAKIFWPIYNEWKNEQAVLRKQRAQKMISFTKLTEIEELSDTEVQSLIINEMVLKQRELNIEKKYFAKLKSSLPIKVIGKYYRAQETFKKDLLIRYRNNRAQRD